MRTLSSRHHQEPTWSTGKLSCIRIPSLHSLAILRKLSPILRPSARRALMCLVFWRWRPITCWSSAERQKRNQPMLCCWTEIPKTRHITMVWSNQKASRTAMQRRWRRSTTNSPKSSQRQTCRDEDRLISWKVTLSEKLRTLTYKGCFEKAFHRPSQTSNISIPMPKNDRWSRSLRKVMPRRSSPLKSMVLRKRQSTVTAHDLTLLFFTSSRSTTTTT